MRRRVVMVILCVFPAMVGGSGAAAPAPPQQQDGAEPAKPLLTLNGDAAIVTILIKPDKTADFELVLAKLKDALHNSPKPVRKAQAEGWTIFKSTQMAQGNVVYIMRIDPVVKGEEYDLTRLIAEVFPVEVQELFLKYKDAFAGRGITEMTPLLSMKD
jgi:hypothetical protein